MFTLEERQIGRLFQLNFFPVPSTEIVFFGLRGCLPILDDDHTFRVANDLQVVNTDYFHPRCTLGQWEPAKQRFAVFPGSTVPHRRYVQSSLEKRGGGANQLLTGFYPDYRKGRHQAGRPTGHDAFRQDNRLPIRRTADDLDYEEDDRVEYSTPFDNLHAGWCMGINSEDYASAGCQVVVGYPKCQKRENQPESGPWKTFRGNAYGATQTRFSYALLHGSDALKVSANHSNKMSARLRYGSQGELVGSLQKKLKTKGYYEGNIDGDFGYRTLRAVLEFQENQFGPMADDGIVGPITASALRLAWPKL